MIPVVICIIRLANKMSIPSMLDACWSECRFVHSSSETSVDLYKIKTWNRSLLTYARICNRGYGTV